MGDWHIAITISENGQAIATAEANGADPEEALCEARDDAWTLISEYWDGDEGE